MPLKPYKTLEEVPLQSRRIEGYPLTLDQINAIREAAETSEQPFAIAFDDAREAFKRTHSVQNDHWIKTKES